MRRLRRLPMSCWGCGDAPRWGRAWSRSLPAQPKCGSVSRETFVRFSIEARRDGIGRENPGGRRRSRARRRYGSARHVDRRGMFPWFHVQQKRAFGTPRCSSAFCSLKLCSKTPGRVSSSLGNAAFGLGSAVSGRVRRAKTSFLLHIALRRRANPPDGTKRRPGAARSEPRSSRRAGVEKNHAGRERGGLATPRFAIIDGLCFHRCHLRFSSDTRGADA